VKATTLLGHEQEPAIVDAHGALDGWHRQRHRNAADSDDDQAFDQANELAKIALFLQSDNRRVSVGKKIEKCLTAGGEAVSSVQLAWQRDDSTLPLLDSFLLRVMGQHDA